MIRKKGIIFILIVIGIGAAAWLFFSDSWFEKKIESIASSANGATVELSGFHLSLLNGEVGWKKLQVTNPSNTMQNLFETGVAKFSLNIFPLFEKKIIIRTMQVESIKTATPRQTDGRLKKRAKKNTTPGFFSKQFKKMYDASIGSAPVSTIKFSKKDLNADSLLNKADLKSLKRMDSLQNALRNISGFWEKMSDTLDVEKELDEIQTMLHKTNPKKIKKLKNLKMYLENLKKSRKKLKELKKRSKNLTGRISKDIKIVKNSPGLVQKWINEDLNRLQDMTQLGKIDKFDIISFVVGSQLSTYYRTWLKYQDKLDGIMKKNSASKPPKEQVKRFKGQDVHFIRPKALPNFWIKHVSFSGTLNSGFEISGEIKNICTQPGLIGRPITLQIDGKRKDNATLLCSGKLDYTGEIPGAEIQFNVNNFKISHYQLPKVPYAPVEITRSPASVQLQINRSGTELRSLIELILNNPEFAFATPEKGNLFIHNAVKNAFRTVKPLKVNVQSRFSKDNSMLAIHSNLDSQMKKAFAQQFGKEKEKAEKQLRRELEKRIGPKKDELMKLNSGISATLESKKKLLTQTITANEKALDARKKEVEKEISSRLKKQGGDLLKKLF